LLQDWTNSIGRFVKVMPSDYKRVLLETKRDEKLQLALG